MSDIGWTHIALYSHDIDESIDFYARYARMSIVHSRQEADGTRVVWLSDRTRPFVLVLIESKDPVENPLCRAATPLTSAVRSREAKNACGSGRSIPDTRSAIGG